MAITGYFLDRDWNYREILLGFKRIHGTYTSANLSTILLKRLQQFDIQDHVLAITTNNTSNNNTLLASIQESVQSLNLPNNTPIIRIPYLAHVIQLSLKELLGLIKANPKNDSTDHQWSDSQAQSLHAYQQQEGIIYTLSKVCVW